MNFGIWNNLDDIALYLGLNRFLHETDEDFYSRVKKFGKWRYKQDYFTQAHSLAIQAGLGYRTVLEIKSEKRFELNFDWEFFTIESFNDDNSTSEFIRIFINTPDCTLEKILSLLELSYDFSIKLFNENYKRYLIKNLIRTTNVFISKEQILNKNQNLKNKNIIPGSLRVLNREDYNKEVNSLQELKRSGDYFIDYENGYIESFHIPNSPTMLTYRFYKKEVNIEQTDINLIPANILGKYGLNDKLIDVIPFILSETVWGK